MKPYVVIVYYWNSPPTQQRYSGGGGILAGTAVKANLGELDDEVRKLFSRWMR